MSFINKKEWSLERNRMVSTAPPGREPIPKGDTGTGTKASGKRKRCSIETPVKCQSFASGSGSGFCSAHDMKFTPVGEKCSNAAKFKCKTPACGNLPDGDIEYCRQCANDIYDHHLTHAIKRGLGNVDEL